jgi:hypothetical protein
MIPGDAHDACSGSPSEVALCSVGEQGGVETSRDKKSRLSSGRDLSCAQCGAQISNQACLAAFVPLPSRECRIEQRSDFPRAGRTTSARAGLYPRRLRAFRRQGFLTHGLTARYAFPSDGLTRMVFRRRCVLSSSGQACASDSDRDAERPHVPVVTIHSGGSVTDFHRLPRGREHTIELIKSDADKESAGTSIEPPPWVAVK